jgi:hypothetical protein
MRAFSRNHAGGCSLRAVRASRPIDEADFEPSSRLRVAEHTAAFFPPDSMPRRGIEGERSGKIHGRTRSGQLWFSWRPTPDLWVRQSCVLRGASKRPPVGIAVLFDADSARALHAESSLAAPEFSTSLILPWPVQIPNISLARLSKMLKSFVDYNIFWGAAQKSRLPERHCIRTFLDRSAPSSPAPLPQGARGEGFRKVRRTLGSGFARTASFRRPTFLVSTQKKSPFFSAPKKPKKSGSGGGEPKHRRSKALASGTPSDPFPPPSPFVMLPDPVG